MPGQDLSRHRKKLSCKGARAQHRGGRGRRLFAGRDTYRIAGNHQANLSDFVTDGGVTRPVTRKCLFLPTMRSPATRSDWTPFGSVFFAEASPMWLDLEFPVFSTSAIPADHGYLLYAAISRQLSQVHSNRDIAIHAIRGRQLGDRTLQLMPWSMLQIRAPQESIGMLVQLAGGTLCIGDRQIRLGVPRVRALEASSALRCRTVTIKGFMNVESFTAAVRRQLDCLEVSERARITIGKRRTVRIRDKEVVGFAVVLESLTDEESIVVQQFGLGGRRRMGCGVFTPVSLDSETGYV
jgi:CRISPR-associated protein Cas6